jgi:quinol monooxygenase YgiN
MIKRIVKMTFRPEEVANFLEIFDESSPGIRAFDGCRHLELWRSKDPRHVFFTYSFWEDEAALEAYRNSGLFRRTWQRTKQLFSDRPEAWSFEVERTL